MKRSPCCDDSTADGRCDSCHGEIRAPLDDPTYQPAHPPVAGGIPGVIRRWGPRSQLRWFRRYRLVLRAPYAVWELHHCDTVNHLGPCCERCEEDDDAICWGRNTCCRARSRS